MNKAPETSLSRRSFLATSAGLTLSFALPRGDAQAEGSDSFSPNVWLSIPTTQSRSCLPQRKWVRAP